MRLLWLIVIVLLFNAFTVYAADRCGAIFVPKISSYLQMELTPQYDEKRTEVVLAVSAYKAIAFEAKIAQQRGEKFNLDQVEIAQKSAEEVTFLYLRRSAEFQELADATLHEAVKNILHRDYIDRSERINIRASLEMERYRLHLIKRGINPEATHTRWAEAFKNFEIDYVKHAAKVTNLLKILREMKLTPGELNGNRNMGGQPNFVYVELPQKLFSIERPKLDESKPRGIFFQHEVKKTAAVFLISSEVFSKARWSHGNSHWLYGELTDNSLLPKNSTLGWLNLVKYTSPQDSGLRFLSEWLFEEIDLKKVNFRVLVHPEVKNEIITEARAVGIPQWVIDRIE